jgi:hypothetical protein
MNDLRFFLKAIEFVFCWLLMWFITSGLGLWVWPLVFAVLCAAMFYAEHRKRARQAKVAEERAIARP